MLLYIYIIIQASAIIGFEVAALWQRRSRLRQLQRATLSDSYIRQIIKMLFSEECCDLYPAADTPIRRMALAEAMNTILSHTYGTNTTIIRELTRRYRLDTFLLNRIRWSRGPRRIHILILMSAIPSHTATTHLLQQHLRSRHSYTRTAALIALLAIDPSKAIATIASLRFDLTPLDIARIITLLRRGILPIAYEPLLRSTNRNLRMLGLAIVRNFGIEIADKQLQNIISTATDADIVHESIYTLSSLGRPLGRAKVRERLSAMTPRRRKQLCRHLTQAGYSLSALRCIFSPHETIYSESIIKSYKRDLVCSTSHNIS